uniref:uncharacterized protein LOC129496708 n=1 Tax=Nyctereutes procyonoides TaxID=34880 RepID=UPI002444C436|nr:uncharacterized protein LOC129496708 [Nyctereutes procyonoides]XP_055160890.1 uncharacterized protein LOC129496708 [Nyctereutes procyonoides]XP_055160891.1 uncharacterized protein LOC129496708 [Nyctereutes procyonoides]XP_055160892.1 uncharacterized protein LOC129496708 [Nyctereutes procyonoides]XP_055160893.1 uncharacterized protein LOC129496708 [Nyctereutes procyonoides]XP_055160894.1 uncharacterized protein LOC129496708 [Nyctereutes procyonoides]XP_055160895.1 uncharacterized protein LO
MVPAWPVPTNLMGRRERWRRYLPLELHGDLEVWHQSGEGGDGVGTGDEKWVGEDWLLGCRVGPHAPRPRGRLRVEGPESSLSVCQLGTSPSPCPTELFSFQLLPHPPSLPGLHCISHLFPSRGLPPLSFQNLALASPFLQPLAWEVRPVSGPIWNPGTKYTKKGEFFMSTHNLGGIVRQQLSFHSHKNPPPGDRSHWCCWETEPDLAKGLSVLLSGSEHEPDPVTHLSYSSTFTMGPCLCPQLPLLSLLGPRPPHQPLRATPTHTATSSVLGVPEHQLSGVRVRGSAEHTISEAPAPRTG